ncbi:MAG TPA: SDR family oxidoreductase [Candidatus Angelobacter sp.]|nr:SDR family oxidoreductase [Candidatus Angelobacter sp.]
MTMNADMKGKVVVITGATSGIGQVAAEELAGMGARIVQVARDRERGEAAVKRLRERGPGIAHAIYYADLLRISEMKRVAAEIAKAEPRIDVLINNAGALFGSRQVTEDGLECTFALNHVSYFVITDGLRERLAASGPARVVNTSSDAHKGKTLDFDDLQSAKAYSGFKVYGVSKLCNILFTRELARRLAGTGVTANCLHPGFVATRFGDQSGGLFSWVIRVAKNFALSPQKGAETLVHLASSPDVAKVTGEYFYKCRPATPTKQAQDDSAAQRLWQETAKIVGQAKTAVR